MFPFRLLFWYVGYKLISIVDRRMDKIWLKSYESGVPHVIDPDCYSSLVEMIEESFTHYSSKPCFVNFGKSLTYEKIDKLSQNFAGWLQQQGFVKGDRIAIMLPNLIQYPVSMFGILRAGMTVVNVNPLYTPRELKVILGESQAKCVIVLENFAHVLEQSLPDTSIERVVITQMGDLLGCTKGAFINFMVKHVKKMVPAYHIPKAVCLHKALSKEFGAKYKKEKIVSSDLAFLQYTGGTTGGVKGAMLTHRNLVANMLQLSAWVDKTLFAKESEGGVITALPLYHIFSLTGNCLLFLRKGYSNILITNPRDIPNFVKELKRQPFSVITGVNTLFNALLHNKAFCQLDFSHLRFSLGGGMAVQRAVAEKWQKVTGIVLLEAYGLTETSPGVCFNPPNIKYFSGSIGLPLPSTEIKICDDNNEEVALSNQGELWVKGPQVMKGYWQKPEMTKEVLSEEGWFKTGDIATIDENGFVRIVDRKKDMIIVSGFNVYPNEVEEVISAIRGVKEVAVIGVRSAEHGEIVKAFIVRSDPTLTADDVLKYCHANLTNYKVPRQIEFRDDLPKTNVGKVLRRALREEENGTSRSNSSNNHQAVLESEASAKRLPSGNMTLSSNTD